MLHCRYPVGIRCNQPHFFILGQQVVRCNLGDRGGLPYSCRADEADDIDLSAAWAFFMCIDQLDDFPAGNNQHFLFRMSRMLLEHDHQFCQQFRLDLIRNSLCIQLFLHCFQHFRQLVLIHRLEHILLQAFQFLHQLGHVFFRFFMRILIEYNGCCRFCFCWFRFSCWRFRNCFHSFIFLLNRFHCRCDFQLFLLEKSKEAACFDFFRIQDQSIHSEIAFDHRNGLGNIIYNVRF